MYTLKEACSQVQEFETLADILKEEMERQVFVAGSDYTTMKIKYDYLGELVNIIKNETIEPTKENK